jgi:diguanylate cyclase (GGDEF)-like protein
MSQIDGAIDRHYAGTMTRMLVQHVRAVRGDDAVATLLSKAGETRPEAALLDDASWSSYDQFRRLLEASVEVLGSVAELFDVSRTAALEAGSMAGATEVLQALGSPEALLAELNNGTVGMTLIENRNAFTEEIGPGVWDLTRALDEGFEPFEELCVFQMATVTMIPRLFGFGGIEVTELECQRRGDDSCRIRLTWDSAADDHQRAEFLTTRLALVERRAEEFQDTVASLVSTEDLEPLLTRIVAAAASTVHAPAFVLTLEPLPWNARLVYGLGCSDAEAAAVAARVAAGDTAEDVLVEVASSRRHYGKLVAVSAQRIVTPSLLGFLQSYAKVAATALDGAVAVEQAERDAGTAQLLLDLAMRVARVRTLQELATTLTSVIPEIVSADRAVVSLLSEDRTSARAIAVSGYTPEAEEAVLSATIPLSGPLPPDILYMSGDELRHIAGGLSERTGAVAIVMVPIVVDEVAIAWISADVLRDPSRLAPSPELEKRLHGLAALASTAMHNALLLDRVSHQAHHDALTGLPNRKLFIDRLDELMASGREDVSVLFVDIDDFKNVNDGMGHHAGDTLLAAVAQRLLGAVREGDLVARLGGDEFAIAVVDGDPAAARAVAHRVIASLDAPFAIGGARVIVGASVGVASGTGSSVEEMVRNADVAMYTAKAAGKGRFALFEPGTDDAFAERLSLHADLADGIAGGQLRVLYQPVFDLATGCLRSGEALVRWEHPRLGMLTPDRFIGLAEETGLIIPLGEAVLEEACREAATWPDDVALAVNLSRRQLDDPQIVSVVDGALRRAGLAPERLVLEITESVLAKNIESAVERVTELRSLGLRIAIDDFGTGYSSLGSLVALPVDVLKIDRTFINGMLERPAAAALVQVLIDMGRTLGLEVVAEGIEEMEQALTLHDQRCDQGQGYLFSPPVTPEKFRLFLDHNVEAGLLARVSK